MSKYNYSKFIPLNSLFSEKLKVTIKEWSENKDAMEEFLWAYYDEFIVLFVKEL